jgi:hypothetical protein
VRSSGSFNVMTAGGTIQGISHRYCRVLQKADGYGINRAGHDLKIPPRPSRPRWRLWMGYPFEVSDDDFGFWR